MATQVQGDPSGKTCTNGWRITGYFLPAEADASSQTIEQIEVRDFGAARFPVDFIRKTKMEGWGLTNSGWYLGWNKGHWVKSATALNAHGRPLHVGSTATDPTVVPAGTEFLVVSAPAPWNGRHFVADDTGGEIKGKHIDIYCGTGALAEQTTYQITSNNGRVCF